MVEAMTGLPGAGKTLRAVNYLWHLKQRGRKIKANIPLIDNRTTVRRQYWFFGEKSLKIVNPNTYGQQWSDGRISRCTDLLEEDNITYLVDEAHIWFDARDWNTVDREITRIFSQQRHLGIDIIWTAQSFGRVLKDLRDLTAFQWKCRRWGPVSIAECWDPIENKKYDSRPILIRPEVFLLYDTTYMVGDGAGIDGSYGTNHVYDRLEAARLSQATFRENFDHVDQDDPECVYLRSGRRVRRWVDGFGQIWYREEPKEPEGGLLDTPARWQLDVV